MNEAMLAFRATERGGAKARFHLAMNRPRTVRKLGVVLHPFDSAWDVGLGAHAVAPSRVSRIRRLPSHHLPQPLRPLDLNPRDGVLILLVPEVGALGDGSARVAQPSGDVIESQAAPTFLAR